MIALTVYTTDHIKKYTLRTYGFYETSPTAYYPDDDLVSDTDTWDYPVSNIAWTQTEHAFEDAEKIARLAAQKYNAQQILRNHYRKPPMQPWALCENQAPLDHSAWRGRKVLRCNRRGIGLRIRQK